MMPRRWPTWRLLTVGTLVLFALHVWLTAGRWVPVIAPDEMGPIGLARFLARRAPMIAMLDAPHISFGYALLLTPGFALLALPYAAYKFGIVLNCALAAGVLPLAYALAREFRPRADAAVAALVTAAYPALFMQTNYLWTEAAFMFFFLLLAWQALRCVHAPHMRNLALLLLNASFLYALHERAMALPVLAMALVGALAWRRRGGITVALGAGALMVILIVLVRWGDQAFWRLGWHAGAGVTAVGTMSKLANLHALGAFAKAVLLQGWYLFTASVGLVVLAPLWLLARRGRIERDARAAQDLWLAFLLLASASIWFASAATLSHPFRADQYIYGRYNEGFLLPWIVLGALAVLDLAHSLRRRTIAITAVVGIVLCGFGFALAHVEHWRYFLLFNASAVASYVDLLRSRWVFAAGGIVVLASLAWMAWQRTRGFWRLAPVLAIFVASIALNAVLVRGQNAAITSKTSLGRKLLPQRGVDAVTYDNTSLPRYLYYHYAALLPSMRVIPFDSAAERPPQTLIIADADFARAHPKWRPRLVAREPHASIAYWSLPPSQPSAARSNPRSPRLQ